MIDPMHQQLLGHLLGALDDDEQEWLDARLKNDGEYRCHCLLWRRRLAALDAVRPEFEPPPGLAERTCRLVAACGPAMVPRRTVTTLGKMSPEAAFTARAAAIAWRDVAALTLLGVMAVALIFPAIYSSRFQARLAACQAHLRQFGLTLADYSHQHGDPLSRLAAGGRLTGAGVSAVPLIEDEFAPDRSHALCPDAWLALQGVDYVSGTRRVPPAFRPYGFDDDWSGTWRTGTSGAEQDPSLPAALPLLADAPSADMPGQSIDAHEGRGRNVFFADGQVRFLPCSASTDAAETVLSGSDSFTAPDGSRPVTFLTWH
jgi:prepilin-type processing-associated H-X9-DG protein